jgi:hypothetical protein
MVSDPQEAYVCNPPGTELSDCSIAEGATYLFQKMDCPVGAASAVDSRFGQFDRILAERITSGETAELFLIAELDSWQRILASQHGHFDPELNQVPKDFQTIMVKDSQRFRKTRRLERRFGRMIYEEVATGNRFYVDEGHRGHSAHLEVFNHLGMHLGTAKITTGELDPSRQVLGRNLDG